MNDFLNCNKLRFIKEHRRSRFDLGTEFDEGDILTVIRVDVEWNGIFCRRTDGTEDWVDPKEVEILA